MTDVHGLQPGHAFNQYLAVMRRNQRQQQAPVLGRGSFAAPRFVRTSVETNAGAHSYDTGNNDHSHDHSQDHSQDQDQDQRAAYSNLLPYSAADTAWPAHVSGIWPQAVQTAQAHAQAQAHAHAQGVPEWPSQQQQQLPPRSHATSDPTTPIIRVTADWPQDFPSSQPQDATYPAASPLPHSDFIPYNPYTPGQMATTHPYSMPQDQSETMQTPVSPVSADNTQHDQQPHHQMMADEQQHLSRKRSHSVMSQQDVSLVPALPQNHSRAGSIASAGASPNDAADDFSPRGSRAFKRGDPPHNSQGKLICTYAAECEGHTFERKCEWSKHMDKHDRPYRCPHPQCAKLQGFTYSGGLLRHEREVHGKHGGPKSQLMCPHSDCKRHTGKGFTRKENLNEHLRRVHPNDKESQNAMLARSATDLAMLAEEGETPISKISEPADHDEYAVTSPTKRKRTPPTTIDSSMMADPEREIKRLRSELAHRDTIIRQYEQDAIQHEQTRRELESLQQRMHYEQQHALQPGQG